MSKFIEKLEITNIFEEKPQFFYAIKAFFVNEVIIFHFEVLVFHIFVLPGILSCCSERHALSG